MVYRGKPSAGCENCRKAKKRCDLEQPACTRCVKLKKTCSGYRDTTSLQIQDESESVKRKSEKQQARASTPQPPQPWQQQSTFHVQSSKPTASSSLLAPPTITDSLAGIPTPGSINSDSTSSSDTIDLERDITTNPWSPNIFDVSSDDASFDELEFLYPQLSAPIIPKPDDIATTYFFNQFTANNHWSFLRKMATGHTLDPCLDLAIKACGMAALGNVENVVMGREYARSMYTVALGLLNDALRDPKRSRTDESLLAVAMLGRYENLTCDGEASIQSWKAHIRGSTQLLKVRGKGQFRTLVGRLLFREMRAQAMIDAIWEDNFSPSFFREYQKELDAYPEDVIFKPIDSLTAICFDLADLRAKICLSKIPPVQAAQQASELETAFIQWAMDTTASDARWRYTELDVEESEHVWDGKVFSFSGLQVTPTMWLTYFNMRIMLTRVQEGICKLIQFSDQEREEQTLYFRRTRRQMTDDICATTPVALGHSSPAYTSPCVLVSAYGALWPLFFAGTCALERCGPAAISICRGEPLPPGQTNSKSAAQAQWIFGRLKYISDRVGLRWADGIMKTLKGDFMAPEHLIQEDDKRLVREIKKTERAPWLRSGENTPQREEQRTEESSMLVEAFANEFAKETAAAAWLGGAVGGNVQVTNALEPTLEPAFERSWI